MTGHVRWKVLLLLAMLTLGWVAAENSAALAAEASQRTGTWEFTLPVRFTEGQNIDFDHGSSIDVDSDLGWGFGFGYNFSEKLNLDFEFSWMSANYEATFASADNPPLANFTASGTLDVSNANFNLTYNFMPKTITPYVSAGFGWNWVDTNIPVGPPQTGCWWDPWYGYICQSYQATASNSGFFYGLGAGIRIEPKESFFFRLGLNNNWQDFGSYSKTPDFLTYRLELGWKF